MENNKLMSLLSKLESFEVKSGSDESHDFVSLSDSFAMKIRGGYDDNTNAVCSGNSMCQNNSACSGNASCGANESCSGNNGCSANEGC